MFHLSIDGPVLISASNLSELSPGRDAGSLRAFKLLKPTAVIFDRGVFVFDGKFDMPLGGRDQQSTESAEPRTGKTTRSGVAGSPGGGALAPDSIRTQLALGDILLEMGQPQQAACEYEKALELAKTIEPEFQIRSVPDIEQRLQSVART